MRMTAEQRREAVVRVALEEFARDGFHAATTVAIAARAGVSQPYLFRLFPTKRAVFLAAAEHATLRAVRAFTAAAEGASGSAALRAGERAWRALTVPGGPFAFQGQLHAASAADPAIRAAAARHWGVLWRTVRSATGLSDPELAAFFGRVLLNCAATALRPPPAGRPPRTDRPPPADRSPLTGRPPLTSRPAPTGRGNRAAPGPAAAPPRPAGR